MTDWLTSWLAGESLFRALRSVLLIVVGLPLIHLAAAALKRAVRKHAHDQAAMLAGKAVYYGGLALLALLVLHNLEFKLTALLGAAGIAGVAIGFAAQTSLSNIISGIFLIWEKPFQVGDMIKVGETIGLVLSIDLLSVKLRTPDNRFIRVPNESLIKSQVITVTRFPIRRMDINVGVAYKEDVGRVMELLIALADANPYSLDEPRPIVIFKEFGDSALELMLGVWFAKTDFLNLKNSLMKQIKQRFDAEGIEIAFPHVTVYSGTETKPFPVRVAGGPPESP